MIENFKKSGRLIGWGVTAVAALAAVVWGAYTVGSTGQGIVVTAKCIKGDLPMIENSSSNFEAALLIIIASGCDGKNQKPRKTDPASRKPAKPAPERADVSGAKPSYQKSPRVARPKAADVKIVGGYQLSTFVVRPANPLIVNRMRLLPMMMPPLPLKRPEIARHGFCGQFRSVKGGVCADHRKFKDKPADPFTPRD